MDTLMRKIMKDWRNVALIIAALAIIYLLVCLIAAKTGSNALVMLNNEKITEGQLVAAMKRDSGEQTLQNLIDAKVVTLYSAKMGVTASAAEVDQIINEQRWEMKRMDKDFDDWLQSRGMTLAEYQAEKIVDIKRVKLAMTQDDLQKAFNKYGKYFNYLPIYKIRLFNYGSEKDALEAIVNLRKPDDGGGSNVQMAAVTSLGGQEAMQPFIYQFNIPPLNKVLSTMQQKEVSDPIQLQASMGGKPKTIWVVVQMLDSTPGEPATFDNRAYLIGYLLVLNPQALTMQNEQPDMTYAVKFRKVEADALNDIDVHFTTTEFQHLQDQFKKNRTLNPVVAPADTSTLRQRAKPGGR